MRAKTFLSTPPSRVATTIWTMDRSKPLCFYPRHPRGWRRSEADFAEWVKLTFLSTPPSRVATATPSTVWSAAMSFYPRHPRGWRRQLRYQGKRQQCFYPRHPRGWRPGDLVITGRFLAAFLSTPPSRVATGIYNFHNNVFYVSIHATLAGGDSLQRLPKRHKPKFLSTPPSRVATIRKLCALAPLGVSIHATLAGGDCPAR